MAETRSLKLKLVSLLGEQMNEGVYEVILPGKTGEITILPDHESLVTLLKPGVVTVRHAKGDPDLKLEHFAISGGVLEVLNNSVVILVDEAESDRAISEKEAKESYNRALEAMKNVKSRLELEEAKELVAHQAARLHVAGLRRKHREVR